MRRRYHIRPAKGTREMQIAFSVVCILVACVFVVIGVTQVIPGGAGLFGLLWTGMAACIAFFGVWRLVRLLRNKEGGAGLYGVEIVSDETEEQPQAASAETRLQELRALYDQRLITQEEYEEKRKEILKEL